MESMDVVVEPMQGAAESTTNPLDGQQLSQSDPLSFPEYASFSEAQAQDLVSTVETLTAELRALRARQDEAAAGLESSIRAVAGWLVEASPNWVRHNQSEPPPPPPPPPTPLPSPLPFKLSFHACLARC
eukprot:SAG22_NODE_118_length_19263_cov_16.155813_11_plen_129_part_00